MVKKINIIVVVIIIGYIIVSKYLSIEIDPCDIECDNCMNPEQCSKCYEDCYAKRTY